MNLPTHTLTIQDVIKWLDISRQTLYDWMTCEGFPYRYIGRRRRFKREEIIDWLNDKGDL